jgi:hypothetical protein
MAPIDPVLAETVPRSPPRRFPFLGLFRRRTHRREQMQCQIDRKGWVDLRRQPQAATIDWQDPIEGLVWISI